MHAYAVTYARQPLAPGVQKFQELLCESCTRAMQRDLGKYGIWGFTSTRYEVSVPNVPCEGCGINLNPVQVSA